MFVISLSGGSGSGKTSIVKVLTKLFFPAKVSWMPMDAYYKDHSHLTEQEKKEYNFDHPDAVDFDLMAKHVTILQSKENIHRPTYSFISCSRQVETILVEPADILIIEGLFSFYDPRILKCSHLKVFVDVSDENRLERIILRDQDERGRTREVTVNRFFETVEPMHSIFVEPSKKNADIIIDANHLKPEEIAAKIFSIVEIMHLNKVKKFEV